MKDQTRLAAAGGLLVLVVALLAFAAGGAGAADADVGNETVGVINDTASVYAELNNTTTDANVTVEFTGIENGTETTLSSQGIVLTADSLELVEEDAADFSQ